jgi:tRNA A37 threonylcarbamoyladenosine biosynthesis protein TsaE
MNIKYKKVIPVIGQQLYRVDIDSEGKKNYPLYKYLAESLSSEFKIKIPSDERYKFQNVCHQVLQKNNYDHLDLIVFLKKQFQKVSLIPESPLWKLARIKNFDFFITTAYDDLLLQTLKRVRVSLTDALFYTESEKIYKSGADGIEYASIPNSNSNLVFHLFGNFENMTPAYTTGSIINTINSFRKNLERRGDDFINLIQRMVNRQLLFLGFEYDDWLFQYLINTISSAASERNFFKLLIGDAFKNKNDLQSPFNQLLQFLREQNSVDFYPIDNRNFVDLLFKEMEEKYPGEIIQPDDFPGIAFISFEVKDRTAARNLASKLRQDGIKVWIDEDKLGTGNKVQETTIKAINQCPFFIPLTSKNTTEKVDKNGELKYHIMEWEYAYARYLNDKEIIKIIPVVLDSFDNVYKEFRNLTCYKIPNGRDGEYQKLKKLLLEKQRGKRGVIRDLKKASQEIKTRQISSKEEKKFVKEHNPCLDIKALEQSGEEEKASQLRMEWINKNTLYADFYNDEVRFLIKQERYWDAIPIIEKAARRNCADNNTWALKEKVIKILSDDQEKAFKKQKNMDKIIIYPKPGNILGRGEGIESAAETLEKSPIITVYGIPGIGKTVFIHGILKKKSFTKRLYKRLTVKPDMTINDLFEQLVLILGCGHLISQTGFDFSKQSDFSFLKTEAQFRIASLIHLDDAHFFFHEKGFRNPAVKEFLVAITQFYPETKIIMESRLVPPEGILPENIYKSIRLHGIHKDNMIRYFNLPFENQPEMGWEIDKYGQERLLKNLGGLQEKERVHPLSMVLTTEMAYQSDKTPIEILTNQVTLHKLIEESADLILDSLVKMTLGPTLQIISQNIKMYRQDIPAYLSDRLNSYIEELVSEMGFNELMDSDALFAGKTLVDYLEDEVRDAVSKKLYNKGEKHLHEIIKLDPIRERRLRDEFGFLYNFSNPSEDENNWIQKKAQIDWRRNVWQVLAERNNFELGFVVEGDADGTEIQKIEQKESPEHSQPNYNRAGKAPVQIGVELETPVLELFERFLKMSEKDFQIELLKKRKQPSGFQFGYDLEFICRIEGDRELKLHIECKNYEKIIKLDDIAGKIATAKINSQNDPIDHWIVIAPFAIVATDLDNALKSWDDTNEYPFKIHVWNKEIYVDQFFGLVPEIYDIFFKPKDGDIHPGKWSSKKRNEILNAWREKLAPPLRLPKPWKEYIRNASKQILDPKEKEFEILYKKRDYIDMKCKDETETVFSQTLEEKVFEWLDEPISESPTLFLLGEFGDGKTFFTYVLTRKLTEKFLQSPQNVWIPIRFSLRDFALEGVKDPRELLVRRLKDIGTTEAEWNELKSKGSKLLAILDGFDEISKELDPETIQRNISILIDCYKSKYFSEMKMLITSRTHFFENQKEKERLLDKLKSPQLLYIASIDRKTTEEHLRSYAVEIGEEQKFEKLKECHDPIGLASKPLFLEMVRVSLKKLPEDNINEYMLYETYIQESLERKIEYLYDKNIDISEAEIKKNLLRGLELVAVALHLNNKQFVYLSDIIREENLKNWLWEISHSDEKIKKDETGRAAARSLLKRIKVKKEQQNDKEWPVDFCHRSMREYFVARAVCKFIEEKSEESENLLKRCLLTHEILFFTSEIMKHKDFDYRQVLLNFIEKTRGAKKEEIIEFGYLGGNAVNLLYKYKGKLPNDPGFDWKRLVLDCAILPYADLSGRDFSETSFRYANLDNVNFANSIFNYCDLTDVRIEETTPAQSIAISPNKKIIALYHDGIIREWKDQKIHGPVSTNLEGNVNKKGMKLISHPESDLTILYDHHLLYYDRIGCQLNQRATIKINPKFKLFKASHDYLLVKKEHGIENRLILIDLNHQTIIKSIIAPPFTLCDHLDNHALIILDGNDELQLIDINHKKKNSVISPGDKVACLATCNCNKVNGKYLLGLGLYNGIVEIWQINIQQWKPDKLLERLMHENEQPIIDIAFKDHYSIVASGIDRAIKLFKFNDEGQVIGNPQDYKMAPQFMGMKIEGVNPEKVRKILQSLIDKATQGENGFAENPIMSLKGRS